MTMFSKFKEMAKKSVDAVEAGIDNTVKSLKEEGLQATSYKIGRNVGAMVQEVQNDVTEYADEIKRANKKATNPVGISFKKGTASHTTAKTVVAAINTMRIIGTDAKNKTNELLEKAEIKKPTM
jgi:hypothetical protein